MSLDCYVALFRGVNVGGHKKVPMAQVRAVFASLGFEHVQTLLNSGNVVFSLSKREEAGLLEARIENMMEEEFGFSVPTIVRQREQIGQIIRDDPFVKIQVTPDIRLYVTFLKNKTDIPITLPYKSEDGSFRILCASDDAIYSVLDVSKMGTTEGMQILEKQWGQSVTTRNWNTIEKVWALMVDG